jgi:hypothetical protein
MLPLYLTRICIYSVITKPTTLFPNPNKYWLRCIRFWIAKLLWLHHDWREGRDLLRKWMPDDV